MSDSSARVLGKNGSRADGSARYTVRRNRRLDQYLENSQRRGECRIRTTLMPLLQIDIWCNDKFGFDKGKPMSDLMHDSQAIVTRLWGWLQSVNIKVIMSIEKSGRWIIYALI